MNSVVSLIRNGEIVATFAGMRMLVDSVRHTWPDRQWPLSAFTGGKVEIDGITFSIVRHDVHYWTIRL